MNTQQRRHFSPPEKVAILRRHFLEKTPVSELCEELGIQPSLFYVWQKLFFENGAAAFESKANGRGVRRAEEGKERRMAFLEAKLQRKDEVIAELMEDHVRLKKELGESKKAAGRRTMSATRSSITSAPGRIGRSCRPNGWSVGSAWAPASSNIGSRGTVR